jgi:drug/metabolite transporter (DMT)-like permease
MRAEAKGYLLGFLGVVIFGLTLPLTRIAVLELDPLFVSIGRTVLAAAAALSILMLTRQPWPSRADVPRLATIAGGVVIGFPVFSAIAMQWVPASHGGVVLGMLPLATAAMSPIFAGETPSRAFWLWAIAGSAFVVIFALWDGGTTAHLADLLLALAILAVAIGYAAGGDLSRRLGGWQVICWALVIALPLTLPVSLTLAVRTDLSASSPAWLSFLYLSLMSQLIGFFAWYQGLAIGGVAKVGQVQLLQIFVTILASALLLGEAITPRAIAFACLVAACVWFGRRAAVTRVYHAPDEFEDRRNPAGRP